MSMQDDIASFWVLRLLVAIKNFDVKKTNWRFTTYAWSYIVSWMRTYQWKYSSPVTMPSLVNSDIMTYNKICSRYFNIYWTQPTDSEIMNMSWRGPEKFEYISNIVNWNYWYYENETMTYVNDNTLDSLCNIVTNKIMVEKIMEYVNNLSETEANIFNLKYIKWETLLHISKIYWITPERVRQLLEQVLFKIRRWLWNMK